MKNDPPQGDSWQIGLATLHALVDQGEYEAARRGYEELLKQSTSAHTRGLLLNDLGVVSAMTGDATAAIALFRESQGILGFESSAHQNLMLLDGHCLLGSSPQPCDSRRPDGNAVPPAPVAPCRIAILSFLFNWPSTGGGIIHTVELAKFLGQAGYDVKHFFAQMHDWEIGRVEETLPIDSEAIQFDAKSWNAAAIQRKYREAVDRFGPDYVIITDSWNFKPLLAEAMAGYPYILRQQALELLCPLNNLRLLLIDDGRFTQCASHQLAAPERCIRCLEVNQSHSGPLHRAERELAGVGLPDYQHRLRRALAESEAVLVLNPLVEAMLSPYAPNVRVATWGMDQTRFPWPWTEEPPRHTLPDVVAFFMAGTIAEPIKGFHVLQEACEQLWARRQDFMLIATGEPVGQLNAFTRLIGWQSQEVLPRQIRAADVLVMPTIAQEGLSRTSVEAMAVGRPVVASRIGGLPYSVGERATGLLCAPGDPSDLAHKMERLIEDPTLRARLGAEGRRRFEEDFTWERVIKRDYQPLLRKRRLSLLAK